MLGEVLRSSFGLLCRSTVLKAGAAGPRDITGNMVPFQFVASPWLPEQLPLAKTGRVLERAMGGKGLKKKVKHNIALVPVLSKQQEHNCQLLCFLLQFLIDWINTTLKEEHIVVKSLEEDLYDGLVLHHLLGKLLL